MAAADDEELSLLAGEYVLGTLAPEEHAVVERRLERDPELARQVAFWERRLAPLALSLPPEPPPAQAWWSIARSLGRAQGRERWWRRAAFWRGWAAAASLAAAALALVLFLQPPTAAPPAGPRLVAVLLDAQARPVWLVSAAPEAERLRARPVATPPAGDRAQELWLLPEGRPPVSLGLLDAAPGGAVLSRELDPERARLLAPGRAVAVSLEPPGGSPTGQPTGPVVYTGVLLGDT